MADLFFDTQFLLKFAMSKHKLHPNTLRWPPPVVDHQFLCHALQAETVVFLPLLPNPSMFLGTSLRFIGGFFKF